MPVGSHIHQLELRHRELEDKLAEVLASPSADDMEIADIKRQK
ncbi:MAG: YdcH family protein, partial [Rhizobiaceae bacterium]